MSWVPARTWVYNEVPTSTFFNEQLRDDFTVLKTPRDNAGRIIAISSAYFADLDGANVTGLAKFGASNSFTAGIHDFGAGATTRFVIPVGADKYGGSPGNKDTGSLWTEGNYLHYVDDTKNEWRYLGTLVGASAFKKGSLWVEGATVHYISENAQERYCSGETAGMHADASAKPGSTWFETYQHWIRESGTQEYNGHVDVAHTDTTPHTDHTNHADTAHNETAHGETAHTDVYPPHQDHTDYVHYDYTPPHYDTPHVDTPHVDTPHYDSNPHSEHSNHNESAADHRPESVGP